MRISDWSSDVCSSDLPPGACEEQQQRQGLPSGPAADRRDELGIAAAHALRAAHPPVGSSQKRERGPARDGADPAIEQRSEEHTSELQSLMRKSYAVFFLKKKTTQTNTDLQHNT